MSNLWVMGKGITKAIAWLLDSIPGGLVEALDLLYMVYIMDQ